MFIPHTDTNREEMLRLIGLEKLEDLFQDISQENRFPDLQLPQALTEIEAVTQLQDIAWANETARDLICFLGAGAYNHYVPAAVDAMIRRGEFYSAYTPYQAEISQGTLQAIFEYQSLIAALTGMDISNASHYDGATAVAEAINMADAVYRGKRKNIVLSPAINPQYRQTASTYLRGSDLNLVEINGKGNQIPGAEELISQIDQETALVMVQYPDFFGRIINYSSLAKAVHEAGALFAVSVNPISLGILKPPGEFGADIVTGEGQPLGIPLSYGGPYLGIFATRIEYVRKMSGRLVGETVDRNGQRGYVLTLTAREQHIRRERATSNICTNQGLMALASTIYMSQLGKNGLKQVAELCFHKAHYAAQEISSIPGFKLQFSEPFFNEFTIQCPIPVEEINHHLLDHGILGGYDLGKDFKGWERFMLIAVTEMNTREDIDLLVEALKEFSHE